MSKQSELNLYIARLHGRLRVGVTLRGAAIFCFTALAVTVAAVLLLNRYAFPEHGVAGARGALIGLLALAAGLGVVWPLVRLTRGRAVAATERMHPELEQRLTTFHERSAANDPFRELLAADTLAVAEGAGPAAIVPGGRLFALAGAGAACLAVLSWLIAAGPGFMGYGASLLWRGAKKDVAPMYGITVAPGDVAIRRNSDQLVTAELTNLRPDKVQLFARFASGKGWEPVAMQANAEGGAAAYHFLFAGLPENVEYYVAAGPLVSPHYKVRVVDLPSVKAIQVTYHYPKWTGMKAVTEEHSGDLRALEGTDAAIEVEMDRPLKDGLLTLDGGRTIQLKRGEGNKYTGDIRMEKDGAYHVAATDSGQAVRLSEDYFISTEKPTPPEVAIQRPGGDYRASPIEEVTVGVKAGAAFGLKDVHLHYSVNGGAEKEVSLLKEPGAKSSDGSHTLRLEDFKLVPGDLVSLYATAKDGHAEARTEISFIQADPFEREFSQSQQSGGGGGGGAGGQNQTEISKREKELIAATWKQENSKTATPKDAAVAGQFLSDAQQKLRDQVLALSARMQSRDLSQANEEFTGFETDMQDAAKAMAPSTDKLKGMEWKEALSLEQKALQSLLRAEATFRKIEVAFGQQQGGGGGGSGAGRDLASLFDLELDTEKNQYETAQTASPQEKHDKDVADALEKLDALAKRQEELASQQKNPQQSFEQRWQQEMLRREAEQLQRQMEQMAQDKQGQQSGQQGSRASSSSGQKGQSGQKDSQQASSLSGGGSQGQSGSESSRQQQGGASGASKSSQDQRIQEATNRLRQAEQAMQRSGGAQGNADAARQAAERLREATSSLGGAQQQAASGKMDSLSREAGQMVEQERAQAEQIDQMVKAQEAGGSTDPAEIAERNQARLQERKRLAAERQQLSDRLSALQKGVRDAARQMASNQPDTAKKLRDALTEMDQSDLDNHVQRTADWLRRGVNPNTNGTEAEIALGLQKLDQQLRQAQGGVGQGSRGQQRSGGQGDQTAALNQVARLRGQLEAMAAGQQPGRQGQGQAGVDRSGQGGKLGQNGASDPNRQTGQLSRSGQGSQPGQNGQPSGQQQATKNGAPGGQGRQQGGQAGQRGQGQQAGNGAMPGGPGGPGGMGSPSGDVRAGGGGVRDGYVWGNVNTGNNQYAEGEQGPVPRDASGNPADTERSYQQSMRALSQLRQMVQGDPKAANEVQDLTRQMQKLDPSRFPGNPALVEQMHREVLSAVDRVELQLQRDAGQNEARTGRPQATPAGYENAVAEYYKRLSKNP